MRGQIIQQILDVMKTNENIFFITADMGINLVEVIENSFPERFTNVGIAEQNMIGIAAGLANLNYRPFVYTISNFAIHRCFEQIRNDIVLHNIPVTILGTSTGYDNAPLGPTHHVIDDWGSIKSFPGIDVFCPSSITYASSLVGKVLLNKRPTYIRIPKGEHLEPNSEDDTVKFYGTDNKILLISYGNPAQTCLEVQKSRPDVSVLILNKLHPLDENELFSNLSNHKKLMVVEDHFADNGLYSSICQILAKKNKSHLTIESISPKSYSFEVGLNPNYFFRKHRLDVESLIDSLSD